MKIFKWILILVLTALSQALAAQSIHSDEKEEVVAEILEYDQVNKEKSADYAEFDFNQFKRWVKSNPEQATKENIVRRLNHIKNGVHPDLFKEIELYLLQYKKE